MSAATLFALQCREYDSHPDVDQIFQLKRLYASGVEYIALISKANILQLIPYLFDPGNPLRHHFVGTEYAGMVFHYLAELITQFPY